MEKRKIEVTASAVELRFPDGSVKLLTREEAKQLQASLAVALSEAWPPPMVNPPPSHYGIPEWHRKDITWVGGPYHSLGGWGKYSPSNPSVPPNGDK